MLPYLEVGTISIATSHIAFLLGFLGMCFISWRRAERYRLARWQSAAFAVLLAAVGVAGVKLLYILENWQSVRSGGYIGMSFFGAVYLVPLLMPLLGRIFRLRARETLDLCALCVAMMVGFMRMGCFMNGCCGGKLTEVFGLRFRIPTQLFESIGDFVILSVLMDMEKKGAFKGRLYALFLIFYGILRFILEFMRTTEKSVLGMSNGQWFSALAVAAGLITVSALKRREERET